LIQIEKKNKRDLEFYVQQENKMEEATTFILSEIGWWQWWWWEEYVYTREWRNNKNLLVIPFWPRILVS